LSIEDYKILFLEHLQRKITVKEPKNLYEPILYILNLEGKRLRPVLTLMSCDLFGGDYKKALDAALAIEMFHNFSLVHDDIMDDAPLRRGHKTVHEKWDLNTGVLSGDAMLVLTNQLFESYDTKQYKELMVLFNQTALKVCEGQQFDIDFETKSDVLIADYIKMISYKTAVLVAASLKMGALIAGTNKVDAQKIYNYGLNLGLAFQLQDDYLDVFGETDFGKQHAGDIIKNKKTWLYLKTLILADNSDKNKLLKLYSIKNKDSKEVEEVIALFKKYKIPELIKLEITSYTKKSFESCNQLSIKNNNKKVLIEFGENLMNRKI
jgi:geranylgeranyl diphosphate synthase type II